MSMKSKTILKCSKLLSLVILGFFAPTLYAEKANWKASIDTRFDARSDKKPRYQYRFKGEGQVYLSNSAWSINGFVATGSGFGSSYNTMEGDADHGIELRRLFLRYQGEDHKTEVGVIPPFKGRVSSTGLSKDGWITGIRHVHGYGTDGKFEVVVGSLEFDPEPGIQNIDADLDYYEFEYSAKYSEQISYELSLEKMLGDEFVRGEVRYAFSDDKVMSLEVVDKLSDNKPKVVLTFEGETNEYLFDEYFLYYAYVNPDFGQRAELIEDFVDVGHAVSAEVKGRIEQFNNTKWFSKVELYQGQSRFQLGLSMKF